MLDGVALIVKGDRLRGSALVRRALAGLDDPAWDRRIQLTACLAVDVWDFAAWHGLVDRAEQRARSTGALVLLSQALGMQAGVNVRAGRLKSAAAALDEAQALIAFTGTAPTYPCLTWSAVRGLPETGELLDRHIADATGRGEGLLSAYAAYARATFHNGRGDPAAALTSATYAVEHLQWAFRGLAVRELIEAAVHAGEPAVAAAAFPELDRSTKAAGTDWGLGTRACCAALLASGDESIALHRTAIEHLERSGAGTDLARERLLFGERLRREGRRTEAREALRAAHDAFAAMGAEGFAARAARELRATGERARKRVAETIDDLTPQELQIARMAATGATSKEIAAELFLSPRTIDAHLRGVFRKLDLSSRRQLRDVPLGDPVVA